MKRILTFIIIITLSIATSTAIASETSNIKLFNINRTIVYGKKDIVPGFLYNGNLYTGENGLSQKTVSIYMHYPAQNWRQIANVTTYSYSTTEYDLKGLFEKYFRPAKNVYYKVKFLGDTTYDASESQVIRTFVKVKIPIKGKKRKRKIRGKYKSYYKIWGKVYPRKSYRIISILVKKKGKRWFIAKRLRLNRRSKFRYRYYPNRGKGIYYIRAKYLSDRYNSGNYSGIKKFRIR